MAWRSSETDCTRGAQTVYKGREWKNVRPLKLIVYKSAIVEPWCYISGRKDFCSTAWSESWNIRKVEESELGRGCWH
jgi:hypothetical protein